MLHQIFLRLFVKSMQTERNAMASTYVITFANMDSVLTYNIFACNVGQKPCQGM
jgi:hypothetical protein